MDADGPHHRAHSASGNHARSGRRRFEHDAASSKSPNQLMRQSVFDDRNPNQIFLRCLHRFFDRQGHFAGLPGTKTYVAGFVAYHHQRRERQILSALHNLGHAIDRNDLIFQIQTLRRYSLSRLSHYSSFAPAVFLSFLSLALGRFCFGSASLVMDSSGPTASASFASVATTSSLLS